LSHDDIERVRAAHEFQRGGVDVQFVDRHVGEQRREFREHAIPQNVRVALGVGLGDQRELLPPGTGQRE
jgi:hypothetical protein